MNGNNLQPSAIDVTPKSISQTEKATHFARSRTEELSKTISILEEKLKPILREPTPITDKEKNPDGNLVAIAGMINKLGEEFEFANERLMSIIARLEI